MPKPIFCKSGASKVPNIGTFPTKSDTTPVPDFNCCSIASLCLFVLHLILQQKLLTLFHQLCLQLLQEFQQLMELMAEILQFFPYIEVEMQTNLIELHF